MAALDWRRERSTMLEGLRRQIMDSLGKIADCFEITGEAFDENFQNELFRLVNNM